MSVEELPTLLETYHISFDDPGIFSIPEAHKAHFDIIAALGKDKLDAVFEKSSDAESHRDLWKKRLISRADEIVAKSILLKCTNANETEWRLAIENKLLSRFTEQITWY